MGFTILIKWNGVTVGNVVLQEMIELKYDFQQKIVFTLFFSLTTE